MRAGSIILFAGLAIGASANAQPLQEARVPLAQTRETMAPVRLASVDVSAPRAPQASVPRRAPVKPRVTTCRCGDAQASPEIAER